MDKYEARYHHKRSLGITGTRRDGSSFDAETDRQAGHAEEFAARELGTIVNDAITDTGDEGCDFKLLVRQPSNGAIKRIGVEVVWNGFQTGSTTVPRLNGHLLVNPFEPWRYRSSDVFVLVAGTIDVGFSFLGWATQAEVKDRRPRSFGFGERYWIPVASLRGIETLKSRLMPEVPAMAA